MNTNPGIIGRKLGNTQVYTAEGNVSRVTVIEAGPVTVIAKRTKEKDGYTALVLGLEERKAKHTTKSVAGQFKKAGTTPKKIVQELRCSDEFAAKYEAGAVMKLDEIFTPGQLVDARGKTRGRGFTGVMRRWSFAGNVSSHGTHEYFRHGGSIGCRKWPGRVMKGRRMPGHMGDDRVTTQNVRIAKVRPEDNLLLVHGSVPGAKGSYVMVRPAIKKHPLP